MTLFDKIDNSIIENRGEQGKELIGFYWTVSADGKQFLLWGGRANINLTACSRYYNVNSFMAAIGQLKN